MVKLVKLVTGEEYVGEVSFSEEKTFVRIDNPMKLLIHQDESGKPQTVPIPISFFAKSGQPLETSVENVLWILDPKVEIANYHKSQFKSGVVEPPEKQILVP